MKKIQYEIHANSLNMSAFGPLPSPSQCVGTRWMVLGWSLGDNVMK